MTEAKQYSSTELKLLKEVTEDPVKWAQVFVKMFHPVEKKVVPWVARWYQVEMLRDPATRRVARCGRRTGKTETMCIEMLWRVFTKQNYRCLVVTPYENQVRLIFMRLKELIDASPMLKKELDNFTRNPYLVQTKNGSAILGFTTGAASGSGGASIRGQRADMIYMDEVDYMGEADFDTVTTIAAERRDIGIFMSSTPTGRRSKFYEACTNKKMGYKEHYHPSMHNPSWGPQMEAEFRAQLSSQGYVHEIEAEFGTQDNGVFNKNKIDLATQHELYAYDVLNYYQLESIQKLELTPHMYYYPKGVRAPMNAFRTMGVDWDKYGASSSILILDFDVIRHKFKVIKRVEVPRGEYSYDNAINLIVELNDQYNPSWIYCDRGAGEYQIERLHIIGDKNPSSNLKNKVKGWHFKNSLDVIDPVSKRMTKEPMKPFMVTQLQIAFEREMMMLSPFDEVLHKQLIDYEVEKISATGNPVFSSENEHFVDALGLAFLAFVLEFPKLTNTIEMPESSSKIEIVNKQLGSGGLNQLFNSINPGTWSPESKAVINYDPTELKGDRPSWVKVEPGYRSNASGGRWGSRSSGGSGGSGRKMW